MVDISLECAIVGQPGTFDVTIDDGKKVSVLKNMIKDKNSTSITCDSKDLKLFLAKTDGGWMRDVDPAVLELTEGRIHPDAQTLIDGERMGETRSIKDVLEENRMATPQSRQVHVVVVVPKAGVSLSGDNDGRSIQKFNKPIEFSELEHEGGVPSKFRTWRKATVAAIASLLDRIPVIIIRAPPLSGKTAMFDLLYNHIIRSKPNALVSRIRANRMAEDVKFADFFKLLYGCDFEAVCAHKGDRVVLIDEAQITYNDELLWRGYVKDTLDAQIPGLRFVLFSSYGSFDAYRKHERAGTPIRIPPQFTLGLNATPSKPGLQVSREELEEMVQNSIGASVSGLVWILCSGHIGIARAILRFLYCKFGSKTPNAEDIEMELRSVELLQYIHFSYRGIPTADAFQRVKKS